MYSLLYHFQVPLGRSHFQREFFYYKETYCQAVSGLFQTYFICKKYKKDWIELNCYMNPLNGFKNVRTQYPWALIFYRHIALIFTDTSPSLIFDKERRHLLAGICAVYVNLLHFNFLEMLGNCCFLFSIYLFKHA